MKKEKFLQAIGLEMSVVQESRMGDFIDDDLLKDWFEEAYLQVDQIESTLLILEKNTEDKEAVDTIFRAAHTLKGGSATVKMDEITEFTHNLEDAMDEVRGGKVTVDSTIVDLLLNSLDIIKNMIEARSQGTVYDEDCSKTIAALKAIVNGPAPKEPPAKAEKSDSNNEAAGKTEEKPPLPANDKELTGTSLKLSEYDILEMKETNKNDLPVFSILVTFDDTNPMRTVGGIQVFTSLRDIGTILKTIPDFDEIYSEEFHQEVNYIIASSESKEKLKDFAMISDMTTKIEVKPLNLSADQGQAAPSEEPVESTDTEDAPVNIEDLARSITHDAIAGMSDQLIDLSEIKIETDDNEPPQSEPQEEKKVEKKVEADKAKSTKNINREKNKMVTSSVLRVDSSRIDELLNLVSEIVINKATFNQINNLFVENLDNFYFLLNDYKDKLKSYHDKMSKNKEKAADTEYGHEFKNSIQVDYNSLANHYDAYVSQHKSIIDRLKSTTKNLDRISSALQEGVMRVRMVQIRQIFSRFPRLVRDLCRDLNKQVELIIEGEETEVDKAMIDDLIDPLIHIVRNAIDHGFETPEKRSSLGKKNPGILKLKAINEGNLIAIYVSDDGNGIDSEKIRNKAISQGIINTDKVMRKEEVYNLLFEPGFSTAQKVTSVSGRGVGLDVVKKNIEKLSGSIRISSELGKGTTFAIKLPLTLAIIQGLMIRVKSEVYALPISSVLDSLRITLDEIKSIDNYEVINVRDDVLSLLRLNRLFNLEEEEKDNYFVVIVGTGDKKLGLLVDGLIGEEDIVIKPLKDKYTNTPGIAGATIYDGAVSLILDVSQLIELGLKHEMDIKLKKEKFKGRE